jgi:molybdenum cofactor synthesis domain-containing protein
MRAEILCVGSELLLGQTIDTNASFIATQLSRAGIDLHRKQTVGDNLERIVDCIRGALTRADALVITGGLGPTTDDLTREGIAAALGVPLEHKPELEQELRDFFARRNYTPSATIMRQAYLPQGAQALPNSNERLPEYSRKMPTANLSSPCRESPRDARHDRAVGHPGSAGATRRRTAGHRVTHTALVRHRRKRIGRAD